MATSPGWVRVHTTYDGFEAKLLAARLGAEGVLCELRGAADSAYPVGPVHLYVPPDEVDEARAVLALVEEGVELGDDEPLERRRLSAGRVALLAAGVVVLLVVALGRVVLLVN